MKNDLHTIFIINLSPFKFVMCCLLHVTICCLLLLIANYYYSSPIVVCCCLLHVVVHCSLPPLACIACFFVTAFFSYTNYPFPLCCYSSFTFATCCDSSFILVLEILAFPPSPSWVCKWGSVEHLNVKSSIIVLVSFF